MPEQKTYGVVAIRLTGKLWRAATVSKIVKCSYGKGVNPHGLGHYINNDGKLVPVGKLPGFFDSFNEIILMCAAAGYMLIGWVDTENEYNSNPEAFADGRYAFHLHHIIKNRDEIPV